MNPSVAALAVVAMAAALLPTAQAATQTTVVRAPVTAVALGPSRATADINVVAANQLGGGRTVYVLKPVVAIGTPFKPAHIRIN